ncbi:hypothetical protein L0663_17490 [Dyadobacter sp. CY107]|uniref:hypothetical protein n=1 Tax=Dyadobacter fanqingshengii TaxID=2906443 RepID=UPI001F159D9A|nr:hypothetical protein [Dyadobacter fanqingshengii]MCF2505191.1 hypothetical protein [Dyadobacter fanqingshengii]
MATISSLVLNIERRNDSSAQSKRTAEVSFTINFDVYEQLADAYFKVEAGMLTTTGAPGHAIGSLRIVRATQPNVQMTFTKQFTRSQLDEDRDFRIENGVLVVEEDLDEWKARVKVTPFVFSAIEAFSAPEIGSWGLKGSD